MSYSLPFSPFYHHKDFHFNLSFVSSNKLQSSLYCKTFDQHPSVQFLILLFNVHSLLFQIQFINQLSYKIKLAIFTFILFCLPHPNFASKDPLHSYSSYRQFYRALSGECMTWYKAVIATHDMDHNCWDRNEQMNQSGSCESVSKNLWGSFKGSFFFLKDFMLWW